MFTFLPFCRRLSVGLSAYSIAVLRIQQFSIESLPSPCLFTGNMARYCGHNLWSVDCGCIICRSISSMKVTLWRIAPFQTYNILSICGYFDILYSCVFSLCVFAFTYITAARHLMESSRSISEGTQNPKLNRCKNTAKIVVRITVVFWSDICLFTYSLPIFFINANQRVDYFKWMSFNNWSYNLLFNHTVAKYIF